MMREHQTEREALNDEASEGGAGLPVARTMIGTGLAVALILVALITLRADAPNYARALFLTALAIGLAYAAHLITD